MATFYDDISRGDELAEEGGQITEARRRVVINVERGTSGRTAIVTALADSQVPAIGSTYNGAIGSGLNGSDVQAIRRVCTIAGVTGATNLVAVQVDIFYKWMPTTAYVSASGSGTRPVTVTKDINGDDLSVTQSGDTYILETTKPVPTSSVTIEIYNVAEPNLFTRTYLGKVNETPWYGGDARTWFCSSVEYEKVTGIGEAETVEAIRHYIFHFEYRADGWDKELAYKDPTFLRVPSGIVAAARKEFEIYDSTPFQNLINLV